MKSKCKRTLSLLLALALVWAVAPRLTLSASADNEVGRMVKGNERHGETADHDESRGHIPDIVGRVIKKREERRDYDHENTEDNTSKDRKSSHLLGAVMGSGKLTGSKLMSHDDTDGFAHRDKSDSHQVPDRRLDI